ncbi:MAG: hypothetical protein PF517_10385 [Salinivirgaceae bacterium]|jgi:hypothetical protein|nr:hypothetical protein [Salinivirgaceae bacterium]
MNNYNQINELKLAKGLIAIGGRKGEGKTIFILHLSNNLAKTERVLFVSYQDYHSKLEEMVIKIDKNGVNKNLILNTTLDYYEDDYVGMQMIKQIKDNEISTIIIDDIHDFVGDDYSINKAIVGLKHLSEFLNIRIIFTINTSKNDIEYSQGERLKIRDFRWRSVVNECDEIYAIYRPTAFGFTEDESGYISPNDTEFYSLKNAINIEHEWVFNIKY